MAVSERTTGTPAPIGFSQSTLGRIGTVLRWIALFVAVVLFLLPFYLILRNALSAEADITAPDSGTSRPPSGTSRPTGALSTTSTSPGASCRTSPSSSKIGAAPQSLASAAWAERCRHSPCVGTA